MRTLSLILLTLSFVGFNALAQQNDDPFSGCERATGDHSFLLCKIGVVDRFIKEGFGKPQLKDAKKQADKACKDVGTSSKLGSRLGLLAATNCEFEEKVNFYNALVDAGVEFQAESVSCKIERLVAGEGQKATQRTVRPQEGASKKSATIELIDAGNTYAFFFELIYVGDNTYQMKLSEQNIWKRVYDEIEIKMTGSTEKIVARVGDESSDGDVLEVSCWENK